MAKDYQTIKRTISISISYKRKANTPVIIKRVGEGENWGGINFVHQNTGTICQFLWKEKIFTVYQLNKRYYFILIGSTTILLNKMNKK